MDMTVLALIVLSCTQRGLLYGIVLLCVPSNAVVLCCVVLWIVVLCFCVSSSIVYCCVVLNWGD